MIDDLVGRVGVRCGDHRDEIDRGRLPRDQLRPLEREHVRRVSAVSRVVVLVAVDHHVRLGVAFARRFGDVHALRQPLADALVGRRHRAIGRTEALDVREQHVAEQVAALQQRRRRDPGAAAGPARDVRRIEQRLAEAAVMRPKSGIVGTSRRPIFL